MDYNVSVIVPVYNAEKYLHQCINSLIKQSIFPSIQVLLVDDGSNDSSGNIIDRYANEYKNIESYHKQNGGSSTARNLGINKAQGEYISFLDSDDWLENDAIETLYNIAINNNRVDIIQFRASEKDNYYVLEEGYYGFNEIKNKIYPHLLPSFTSQGKPTSLRWSNCLRFYRLSLLKENNIQYRESAITFEDCLFNVESVLAARSYYYIDKPLYHVVNNPASKSRNYQPAMFESCDFILKEIQGCLDSSHNKELFSYYESILYFADACITNEMSQKSLISNIIRIKKVLNSSMCKYLRENDGHNVTGWYGKVLQLIKRNSAVYLVYRYKIRKYILRLYGKIKH